MGCLKFFLEGLKSVEKEQWALSLYGGGNNTWGDCIEGVELHLWGREMAKPTVLFSVNG